jgi:hypothetical protein
VLDQHGANFLVGLKESNGRVSIPEAQAVEFVLALHVWHPEFQYRGGSVSTRSPRHPRATYFLASKGYSEREGPSALQGDQHVGQSLDPCRTLGRFATVSC